MNYNHSINTFGGRDRQLDCTSQKLAEMQDNHNSELPTITGIEAAAIAAIFNDHVNRGKSIQQVVETFDERFQQRRAAAE